uniref:AN1-type domain-containing protein n=1 Tax=Hyaloperonospora arabidopsidis (strain Emoy2) TaxID=559515 RepID=M4BTV6_HYAAE
MCSVCWKKTMSDRQAATSVASPRSTALSATSSSPPSASSSSSHCAAEAQAEPKDEHEATLSATSSSTASLQLVQKNKKRCWECKKKVGLTAMDCRCGYVFCSSHRFEDQHRCTFDFRTADRRELARRNPGGGAFSKLEKLYYSLQLPIGLWCVIFNFTC